jgi:hypothetical protein
VTPAGNSRQVGDANHQRATHAALPDVAMTCWSATGLVDRSGDRPLFREA